ncbi:CPBP family glutamic-type intramembrane protease [Pendulispora rubella]|uniref:CPBP family glutamic-type intramembrane protease n=1 Tax=Pendulispora rubella TaxID=2741070 RepID=A0ABZ2L0L0_9BACT
MSRDGSPQAFVEKPGAWIDLALTLPLFLAYHAGVVFLKIQNATDVVTPTLVQLAEGNRGVYLLMTASIGVVFAGIFAWLGRGQAFRTSKFAQVIVEGALYAIMMRVAGSYVVSNMFAPQASLFGPLFEDKRFVGMITSMGAGFYEELAFRVVLFGLGAKVLVSLFAKQNVQVMNQRVVAGTSSFKAFIIMFVWMFAAAALFSGMHYIGALGDKFQMASFIYRMVIGVVLTIIYLTRGFSTAVWAHALYDIWVLVF